MNIMVTSAAGSSGEHHQAGGDARGEEGRTQCSTTTTGGPGSIAAAAPDEAAALDGTKVRKPYTITKQRERWTDEEHQKFLEALKLYGRAWRRIEEHIGTKTAVQIRSHAQKVFSKVERNHHQVGAAGGVIDTGVVLQALIDIPPPRPKRKPSHPYPRKARGNAAASKHSEHDAPVVCSLSAVLVTEKPEDGFGKTTTSQEEEEDDDDATEEVLQERISPNALPKDDTSVEDKLPAVAPPIQQEVLSKHLWVPFPAFHQFPPQWGSSFQHPNQDPACQNFENWAKVAGVAMPREHVLPWYHASQMASSEPQELPAMAAAAALWPAIVSGASMAITPVPDISEIGSHTLFKEGAMGSENEASASKAMAAGASATIAAAAAASAWWAFTQSLASPLSLAAMGALYNPLMATMPSPSLFPQGKWLQHTKLQNPEPPAGEEEDTPQVQTLEEPTSKELLRNSGHGLARRSSTGHKAERAIKVQEVKARKGMAMGSSAGSSDFCVSSSSWGGSCSKPESGDGRSRESGQKLELVNHSVERICTSPYSAGSSPTEELHKLKSQLSGLVQKELSSAHARRSGDEEDEVGFENWKHLQCETFSGFSTDPVTSGVPALQLVKSGDISGSSSFPTKCSILTENTSAEGSAGAGGPSSNSSACGNLPEGNDHSGSSNGSSDVEAAPNVPSSCKGENERISAEAEVVETEAKEGQVSFTRIFYDGFTPFREDSEKHPQKHAFRLLPRTTLSSEAEQQNEAMGRSQIGFQALFARETLPRTFSPPRSNSLEACRIPTSESGLVKQSLSLLNLQSRISSHSKASSSVSLPADEGHHHPQRTIHLADQDSAFNAWQPSKGSKLVTAEIERHESSSITVSSGAQVTNGAEAQWSPKQTKDTKRRERRYREGATFNWLTLRTESSGLLKQDKDDSQDLHLNLHQEESLQKQQTLTQNIGIFPPRKKEKFAVASSSKVDDTCSSAFSELSTEPLSGNSTHSSFSLTMATSSGTDLRTVSSNSSVKYSGVGFVPYQRPSEQAPSHHLSHHL